MALAQQGSGTNATKQAEQSTILLNRKGKPVKCFKCGGNHSFMMCPLVSKEEAKKIMQDRRTKWEVYQAARWAGKQQTTPGQAHVHLSTEEIGGEEAHKDDYCSDVEDAAV